MKNVGIKLVTVTNLNSTYVIERLFSFTLIVDDMKRTSRKKKAFKPKKPSRGSMDGPGPAASTSTSTGTTDLMPSIPACDSDGTTSAQLAAGVSVSV